MKKRAVRGQFSGERMIPEGENEQEEQVEKEDESATGERPSFSV